MTSAVLSLSISDIIIGKWKKCQKHIDGWLKNREITVSYNIVTDKYAGQEFTFWHFLLVDG